jgi:hypothetical protein
MSASEAQIKANQANAQMSTGPKSPSGKIASSQNSYKHGLTATKLLPEREAIEVERRFIAFCEELQPSGEVGISLARVAATMAVRMERSVEFELASLTARVRQAEADFVPPEGVDEATAVRLRLEAGKLALFDDSKEACLARKYEAASQRAFFKALQELRLIEKRATAVRQTATVAELGSILPTGLSDLSDADFEEAYAKAMERATLSPFERLVPDNFATLRGRVDVPFSIGKRR